MADIFDDPMEDLRTPAPTTAPKPPTDMFADPMEGLQTPYQPTYAKPTGTPTWSDWGGYITQGYHEGMASVYGGLSTIYSDPTKKAAALAGAEQHKQAADDTIKQMSPAAQESATTGSGKWGRDIATTILQSAVPMAVMAGPAAALGPIGVVGEMAGGALGMGAYGGGEEIAAVQHQILSMPKDDLMKVPYFKGLVDNGMNESDARNSFIQYYLATTGVAEKAAIINAIGGLAIPGIAGTLEGGLASRVLKGGVVSAGVMGTQSGLSDIEAQTAAQSQGLQDKIDPFEVWKATKSGMLMGGVFGALGAAKAKEEGRKTDTTQQTKTPMVHGDTRAQTPPPARPVDAVGTDETGDTPLKTADQAKKADADQKQKEPVGGENVSRGSPRGYRKPIILPSDIQKDVDTPADTGQPPAVGGVADDEGAALKQALPQERMPPPTIDSGAPPSTPAPEAAKPTPVPETQATIGEQLKGLVSGDKEAVQAPYGTILPPMRMSDWKNIREMVLPDNSHIRFRTDGPNELTIDKVKELDNQGRLNEILGLGPHSQTDIMERERAGEPPVAITERTPDNLEIKTAAGTTETAPDQIAALEDAKLHPDNTVQAEDPRQVITDRIQGAQQEAQPPPTELPIVQEPSTVPTPAGLAEVPGIERAGLPTLIEGRAEEGEPTKVPTKKGKAAVAKRTSDNNVATEAMNLHPITEMDTRALLPEEEGGVGARNLVRARLQRMIDYVESRGVTIPKLFREPKTDLPPHADAQILLRDAKNFLEKAAPTTEDYKKFLIRENDIRQGRREDVLKERISEAEEAKAAKEHVGPRAGVEGGEALEKIAEAVKEEEPTEEEKQDALQKLGERIKEKLASDPYGEWRQQIVEQGKKLGLTPQRLKEMVDRLTKEGEAAAEIKRDGVVATRGADIKPHSTTTVGELLQDITPKGFQPGMKSAVNTIINKIMEVAKDVPIHMVNNEEMEKIPGAGTSKGLYDPFYDHIILNTDRSDDVTLFHEAFHAATVRAILNNKNLHSLIDRLWQEADPDRNYNFPNSIEFLTEFISNPLAQKTFGNRRISDQLANDLDIPKWRKHTVFESVLAAIRKAFGLGPRETGVVEAALALAERAIPQREFAKAPKENLPEVFYQRDFTPKRAEQDNALKNRLLSSTRDMLGRGRTAVGDTMWTRGLSLLPTSTIRSWFEGHFSEGLMRQVQEGLERAGTKVRQKLKETDIKLRRLSVLRIKDPEMYRNLVDLMHDSSAMRVHADQERGEGDNTHLRERPEGKEAQTNLRYMQGYDAHPELYDRFDKLSEDAKQLYKDWRDVGKSQLEGDVEATESNIVHAAQRSLDKDGQLQDIVRRGRMGSTLTAREQTKYDRYMALSKVIAGNKLDDDEWEAFKGDRTIRALLNLRDVKNHKGPYFPSTRFGDYVVTAKHDFKTPTNGIRLSGDESNHIVFKTREDMFNALSEVRSKQIQEYNKKNPGSQMMDRLYAEPEIRYFAADPKKIPDPEDREYVSAGEAVKTPGYKVMPEFRIVVQDGHVELAESKAEGLKRQAAMRQMGLEPSDVMLRKDNKQINYGANGSTIDSLRDAIDRMDLTESEKNAADTAIDHLAATTMRGSRLAGNLLRRNNIKGADSDMIRALDQRRTASAVHQSYAEVMPDVNRAMSDMREEAGGGTFEQSALYREFQQRVNGFGAAGFTGQLPWILKTMQTIGYLKYLISPANLAMHLTHPTLVSIPEMAKMKGENIFSVHGRMLSTYRMMGGVLPTVFKSLQEAKAAWAFDHMPNDWVDSLIQQMKKNGASKELLQALQEGIETGHLHTTGYDFSPFYDTTTRFDRGMAKVRDMSQETTGAVDAINRVAVFSTAFKMARDHGMDYDAALKYAKDTTSETLGLFSPTNRARAMQLPIVRSVLQFKMIPMMIYNILARNTYNLIKGESTEAKWMALKGLSGMLGTSFALAGLSGATPEPIRLAVTMGNLLGVNDSWQEQQDKIRKWTNDNFGSTISGMINDGLGGFAGANVSHRFGVDDLMVFGEPHSNKPSDIMNWLYGMVGGVPGGLVGDSVSTVSDIRDGNYEKALEDGIPAKGITDLLKAGRLYMEGKPTAGGAPGMPPLGPWGAIVQAMGWQPESAARYGEAQAVLFERRQERQQYISGIRQQFMGGERATAMERIQAWNVAHPESPISLSQMLKQQQEAKGPELFGQKITPRNRLMLEQMKERYLQ